MEIEHQGKAPEVHATAQVAPTAVLSDEVRLGPGALTPRTCGRRWGA